MKMCSLNMNISITDANLLLDRYNLSTFIQFLIFEEEVAFYSKIMPLFIILYAKKCECLYIHFIGKEAAIMVTALFL